MDFFPFARSSPAYFLIAEASFLLSSMQKSNGTGLAARGQPGHEMTPGVGVW
jgi:hypothetical protein